jgi:hypothetical protein
MVEDLVEEVFEDSCWFTTKRHRVPERIVCGRHNYAGEVPVVVQRDGRKGVQIPDFEELFFEIETMPDDSWSDDSFECSECGEEHHTGEDYGIPFS